MLAVPRSQYMVSHWNILTFLDSIHGVKLTMWSLLVLMPNPPSAPRTQYWGYQHVPPHLICETFLTIGKLEDLHILAIMQWQKCNTLISSNLSFPLPTVLDH